MVKSWSLHHSNVPALRYSNAARLADASSQERAAE